MDVVWLKKDVRLRDHGPLAEIAQSMNPFLILYLYEPDQLSEPTVHGSHIQVVNEGLIDLDQQLCDHQGRDFVALTVCHAEAVNTLIEIHQQNLIGFAPLSHGNITFKGLEMACFFVSEQSTNTMLSVNFYQCVHSFRMTYCQSNKVSALMVT